MTWEMRLVRNGKTVYFSLPFNPLENSDYQEKAIDPFVTNALRFISDFVARDIGDPVGDFHRSRGCCDGSDPSGCHRRRTDEQEAAAKAEREARRVERETALDEYAGTTPSCIGPRKCMLGRHDGTRCLSSCGFTMKDGR